MKVLYRGSKSADFVNCGYWRTRGLKSETFVSLGVWYRRSPPLGPGPGPWAYKNEK